MEIDCHTTDGVEVIRARGDLRGSSTRMLRDVVYATLVRGPRKVLLNLAKVSRIDAAGLGVLAHVHRMATVVGALVTLTDVSPRVREMLDVVGLSAGFDIVASESDAIEEFELCSFE